MQSYQSGLVAAWKAFAAGEIDAKELKGASAPFGIYLQRDGAAMMRVRRPGGIVTAAELRALAGVMDARGAGFAHLTDREDVQLHGVPAAEVPAALEELEAAGFGFRGGGGDTFRNAIASPFSGLHEDSAFDVVPYARAMTAAMLANDRAFALPRKLKIGFADRAADTTMARSQDLGFVARIVNGERCFETWLGGGIGAGSRLGFRIHASLHASECLGVAFALVRLFDERGRRDDRSRSRLRFLREELGDDALATLLDHQVFAGDRVDPFIPDEAIEEEKRPEPDFSAVPPAEGFETWKALAAEPLAGGRFGVRVSVPDANFTSVGLRRFADVMEAHGAFRFQISPRAELLVDVSEGSLPGLHAVLARDLGGVDFAMRSFAGRIRHCIGSRICASGAWPAPEFARELALALDARLMPLDTPEKIAAAKLILEETAISGCPNSCARPQTAGFGFVCRRGAAGPELVPYSATGADGLGAMDVGAARSIEAAADALVAAAIASTGSR